MPYESRAELPKGVRDNLPAHAQESYKEAFNSAWEQYEDKSKRRGDESREETAHRVAWAAVEKQYHKTAAGDWKRND